MASRLILIICIILVFGHREVIRYVSKVFNENYYKAESIEFNHNSDFENRAKILSLDKAYVVLESDALYYYDEYGNLIWSKAIMSKNTLISAGEKTMVIAEKKAGDVFVIDSNGDIVASILGLGSIQSIQYFEESYIGILKEDNVLSIYDVKMNLIGNTAFPDGQVIDYGINLPKEDVVAVLLDLSRTDFNSKLIVSTFNGDITSGSNLIEEIVYGIYLSKAQVIIVSDNHIRIFDYNTKRVSEIEMDRITHQMTFDEKEEILYVQVTNVQSEIENPKPKQSVIAIDTRGKITSEFEVSIENVIGMTVFKDTLLLYNQNEIVSYKKTGEYVETYESDEMIYGIIHTKKKSFGVIFDNYMDIYREK